MRIRRGMVITDGAWKGVIDAVDASYVTAYRVGIPPNDFGRGQRAWARSNIALGLSGRDAMVIKTIPATRTVDRVGDSWRRFALAD